MGALFVQAAFLQNSTWTTPFVLYRHIVLKSCTVACNPWLKGVNCSKLIFTVGATVAPNAQPWGQCLIQSAFRKHLLNSALASANILRTLHTCGHICNRIFSICGPTVGTTLRGTPGIPWRTVGMWIEPKNGGMPVGFPGQMSLRADTDHPYWAWQTLSDEQQKRRTTKWCLIICQCMNYVVVSFLIWIWMDSWTDWPGTHTAVFSLSTLWHGWRWLPFLRAWDAHEGLTWEAFENCTWKGRRIDKKITYMTTVQYVFKLKHKMIERISLSTISCQLEEVVCW